MSSLLRRPARAPSDADEQPGRASSGDLSVVVLDDSERHSLRRLVETDPIVNAVLAARLDLVGSLSPRRLGGTVFGVRDAAQQLRAAVFHGGNLLPVGGDPMAWTMLGRHLAAEARVCSSIVGLAPAVEAIWAELAPSWGPARAVRERQPLLVLPDRDSLRAGDPEVRQVVAAEVNAYVPAAAAMFTEELGISPYRCAQMGDYRRRVAGLIREGRAFARFDEAGEVVFKADLGAVSRHTCQVQGVWVRPDLRGRGIGTRGLATVLAYALTLAPTVSLYVNDFNVAARQMYARLGMHEANTLSTVLF